MSTSLAKQSNSYSFVSPTHSFTYNLENSNPKYNHEHSMVQKICRDNGSSGTSKYKLLFKLNYYIITKIEIIVKLRKIE